MVSIGFSIGEDELIRKSPTYIRNSTRTSDGSIYYQLALIKDKLGEHNEAIAYY